MKEPMIAKFLKIILYVGFVIGVLGMITLPWMLEVYTNVLYGVNRLEMEYRRFILTFLLINGILLLWMVREVLRLLHSIPTDPFVMRNVKILKRIAVLGFVMAFLFFAKCFYYVTFLTLGCGILFFMGALFALTLANLFHQAVVYKEENELTI